MTCWLAGILLLAMPALADPSQDLIGHWRSNRELTALEMEKSPLVTPEKRAVLEPMFGDLIFSYTPTKAGGYLDGAVLFVTPYEVIFQTERSVIIEFDDELEGRRAQREIFVRGDRMRAPIEKLGFDEIFTRIEDTEVPAALARAMKASR